MPKRIGSAIREFQALYVGGVVGQLSDGELLERFRTRDSKRPEFAEAAFKALVDRHGPMVSRVCRDVLAHHQDAEDAFQATFLILAKQARSVRKRDSVASWLHGVARRVALRAKAEAARRRVVERNAGRSQLRPMAESDPPDSCPELHDEIAKLPESYRLPVLFCLLQGCTQADAAARLGWPLGTLKVRLSRARKLLQERLTRRGLAPAILPPILGLPRPLGISAHLVDRTVQLAFLATSKSSLTSVTTGSLIISLAQKESIAMTIVKGRLITIALLMTTLGGFVGLRIQGGQEEPEPNVQAPKAEEVAGPDVIDPATALLAPTKMSAHHGRGTILVYSRDQDGNLVIEDGQVAPENRGVGRRAVSRYRESEEEIQWVILAGILDQKTLLSNLNKTLGQPTHPEYQHLEVQRQTQTVNGKWCDWEPMKKAAEHENIRYAAYEFDEPTRYEVRDNNLVDFLPNLVEGTWKHFAPERFAVSDEVRKLLRENMDDSELTGKNRQLKEPELLVRALDLNVKPGKIYRYRARVILEDPRLGSQARLEIQGPWSEPTEPLEIPIEPEAEERHSRLR